MEKIEKFFETEIKAIERAITRKEQTWVNARDAANKLKNELNRKRRAYMMWTGDLNTQRKKDPPKIEKEEPKKEIIPEEPVPTEDGSPAVVEEPDKTEEKKEEQTTEGFTPLDWGGGDL